MDKRTLDGLRSKVIVTREASVCDQARTGARRRVGPHEVLPPGFTGARVACHAASAALGLKGLGEGGAQEVKFCQHTRGRHVSTRDVRTRERPDRVMESMLTQRWGSSHPNG